MAVPRSQAGTERRQSSLVMRRFSFPTAPVVVGMILGPLAEAQLRNAMSIGEGSAMVFLQRPVSLMLLVIVVAVLLVPRFVKQFTRKEVTHIT